MTNIQRHFRHVLLFLAMVCSGHLGAVDVITVQTDLPTELEAGGKRSVQVTINKDQVQGFSKLEFTLPDGMMALAGDTKGGSFTFTGQKAKFIWMTLPEQSSFTISYEIQVGEHVMGDFQIQGVFSYVNQNKREDLKLPAQRFYVRGMSSPQSLEGLVESNPNIKTEPELLELICSRELTRISDTEFLVRLIVVNNKIEGFGKILELLPDNCTTERENDGGAIITQDMHSIKFVWFEVPLSETFEVSYRVFCTSPEAMLTIRGELSYTEGGKPVTVKIQQAAESSEPPVAEQTQEAPKENEETSSESAVNTNNNSDNSEAASNPADGAQDSASSATTDQDQTPKQEESIQENQDSKSEEPTETAIADDPKEDASDVKQQIATNDQRDAVVTENDDKTANQENVTTTNKVVSSTPESGVTYKVQILAAHRVVDKTYLKSKYGFRNKYNIENHEGWVKYTTGMFGEYEQARNERERLKSTCSNLPGPFVTAYSDGERITVQEALLLSKQKWVQ